MSNSRIRFILGKATSKRHKALHNHPQIDVHQTEWRSNRASRLPRSAFASARLTSAAKMVDDANIHVHHIQCRLDAGEPGRPP